MRSIALAAILCTIPVVSVAQEKRIVIAAGTMFDGKGGVQHGRRIAIEGSRIVDISSKAGPADYDLRGLTVLPGWIDCHVHITWSFGTDGKNAGQGAATPAAAYAAASNAWVTLMAGFTTVQSVGSPDDVPLRDAIARGRLPGPRILTAIDPLMGQGEKTGTPDQIRAYVRKEKAAGADLIKIYASGGMLQGKMTLSEAQLDAACDEARKQGLRTLVHAYRDAVRAATLAGCTEVEHGLGASDEDLKLMAEKGTYFDPQAGLLLETYIQDKDQYAGTPFFPQTAAGFAAMGKILPMNHDLMRRAAGTAGLKIVFGTDAVAGAHGRNAEEFVERVRDCGVDPMAAMVSAHSVAADALGMADQIGSIAPGRQADIIALDGNPAEDITAVRRVVFVMKGGVVYKNVGIAPDHAERFDMKVREDFFAGMRGDREAFQRAMETCETRLKARPKDPEALVWHGAGLCFLAGQASAAGGVEKARALRRQGSAEMDEAVALRPAVETLVPRASTLLNAARRIPQPEVRQAVLKKAIGDLEQVLKIEDQDFSRMCVHDRGELLGGWRRRGTSSTTVHGRTITWSESHANCPVRRMPARQSWFSRSRRIPPAYM
ncbi:MAG TPA: amidohydrolase family protein [Bryobacteraceae bacterium]|nr:amidohydrolase family protein [Bryobacteraceae bacterium]